MKVKIVMSKNDNAILFQEINEKDNQIIASIGLQYYKGKLTVFMKGNSINDKKDSSLEGYYVNTLTKKELNEFIKFLIEKVIE